MLQVIDTKTKKVIGSYGKLEPAHRQADKLNRECGEKRYVVIVNPILRYFAGLAAR